MGRAAVLCVVMASCAAGCERSASTVDESGDATDTSATDDDATATMPA
jgi:hypothetical protein